MVYISTKQKLAMGMIDEMLENFDDGNRWFTQHELLGITLHTMKALVEKEYLQQSVVLGIVYYQRVKMLED